mmetsp:Transcript_6177/g.9638  ORF Transcript_6177/g.9638 Transcript_6177/m.9638 type:complete len:950 (-) Transcript_6177:29-2878(-)|eukprot:CAMPEP_0169077076 /NCGR_PEP_ID=MMETSP1015-20121227/8686_1 /TAXON_ID=342587 /ORGANISM="Karlodinium micrum, Strain CCMP2283" /LENGTH=949 /DNA_ID=CAMNT_0009136577 /DNA_START=52 /DNA_END=2901 /DNA_ORIENTATION=-
MVLGGTRDNPAQRLARHELLPPTGLTHSRDARRFNDGYVVAKPPKASEVAEDIAVAAALVGPAALKAGGGQGVPYHAAVKAGHARAEVKPPPRELDVPKTVEVLRHLRKEAGLFRDLSLEDLEHFAEACSPLGFTHSQVLFSRGEMAIWFGVLLSGQAVAYLPGGGANGDDLILGSHGPGRLIGIAKASLWERSHVRAYSLKASEAGYAAVLTFDQLETLRRTRPAFHLLLVRAVLAALADAAAGFFRGCPLSCGTRWPIIAFGERRILDFLLKLREDGRIFSGVDYRALLALSCRLRIAQFEARSSILARGAPVSAALLVLDGRLTAFRDPGAAPFAWYGPGDVVAIEAILGGRRPCPVDVFAARPSYVAILLQEDLEDLGREFPSFGLQVLQSLYAKLFGELADPHGRALLLLADGASEVGFAPGASPPLPPGPGRLAGGFSPEDLRSALSHVEATVPNPSHRAPRPLNANGREGLGPATAAALVANSHSARGRGGATQAASDDDILRSLMMTPNLPGTQTSRDDAAIRACMLDSAGNLPGRPEPYSEVETSFWHMGDFFAQKFSASRARRAERVKEARAAASQGKVDSRSSDRPTSAPPTVRTSHAPQTRRSLAKAARGLDVTATEFDPSAARAPYSSGLRRTLTTASCPARYSTDWELRHGIIGEQDSRGRPASQPWALRRANSAPPDHRRMPSGELERSHHGAASFLRAGEGSLELLASHCPTCGRHTPNGGRGTARRRRASPLDDQRQREEPMELHRSSASTSPPQGPLRLASSSDATSPEAEKEMRWYFEQQRRFLFDLRSSAVRPEEAVAVDQHQAWNLKVISQQHDIERLQAALRTSEEAKAKLQADVETLLRERDEWKASALRMQLNREFKTTVDTLSADQKRFLRHGQHTSLPDFEQSLRQQIQLMETDVSKVWRDEVEHRVPSATSTFSRYADIRSP